MLSLSKFCEDAAPCTDTFARLEEMNVSVSAKRPAEETKAVGSRRVFSKDLGKRKMIPCSGQAPTFWN